MFIYVDLSYLGLTVTPYDVNTFLTCSYDCVRYTGSDIIEDLTKDGFKVYLRSPAPHITPEMLKKYQTVLHWQIQAMIPPQ